MKDNLHSSPPNEHDNYDSFSYFSDSSDEHSLQPNEIKGDPLLPKSIDILRIMFQNVNGINVKTGSGDFDKICKDITTTDTDILLLAEPNLQQNMKVREHLIKTVRLNQIHHPKLILSSSNLSYSSNVKPGSTMTIAHGRIVGRITNSGIDDYG